VQFVESTEEFDPIGSSIGKKPLVQQEIVGPEGALRPVLRTLGFEEFLDGEGDGGRNGFQGRWRLSGSPGLPLAGNPFGFVPGVGMGRAVSEELGAEGPFSLDRASAVFSVLSRFDRSENAEVLRFAVIDSPANLSLFDYSNSSFVRRRNDGAGTSSLVSAS
jgi:hypothetical protein